jgi:hypothetical protein
VRVQQLFFLLGILVDDYTDKKVKHDYATDAHEDYEVGEQVEVGRALWLKIHAYYIDTIPHKVDPAFGGHRCKQCNHRVMGVVEVCLRVHPFTTRIIAVPDCLYFEALTQIMIVTVGKLSFEKGRAKDAEK